LYVGLTNFLCIFKEIICESEVVFIMDKNVAVGKVKKIGKIGYVVSTVAQVVLIIGLVAAIIGAIVLFALPDDMISFELSGNCKMHVNLESVKGDSAINLDERDVKVDKLELGDNKYNVVKTEVTDDTITTYGEFSNKTVDLGDMRIVVVMAVIYVAVYLFTMIFVKKLFKSLKNCNSPFDTVVIANLKKLAYACIPWVFLAGMFEGVSNGFVTDNFDFGPSINLVALMLVLILLALAYVFQYGAELQKESDETL